VNATLPWLIAPAAYVLGSLSPAYWAGRVNGIDLRKHGSKNLGATNAGRVLGRRWFFIVFALDVAKGWLPVFLAHLVGARALGADDAQMLMLATAVAAVLGHSFTCFHGFKGGKAVATSLGVLIALAPIVAAIDFAVWIVAWLAGMLLFRAKASNAVGPASVLAAIAAPIARCATTPDPWHRPAAPVTIFILALAILVVVRHRKNIQRLFARPEPPAAA
jgi:acyl phosphate:glycerol-3-phosphate acyltransferase